MAGAICKIGQVATPVVEELLERWSRSGDLSPEGAEVLRRAFVAGLMRLCAEGRLDDARAQARKAGLGIEMFDRTPMLFALKEPTPGGPPGTVNPRPNPPKGGGCGCDGTCSGCQSGDWCEASSCASGQVNQALMVPLGSANCLPWDLDIAPCDVNRIMRQERRPVFVASTTNNTFVRVPGKYAALLNGAPGRTWYRLYVPAIRVAAFLGPRNIQVRNRKGEHVEPLDVGIAAQLTFKTGNGSYVEAWDYACLEDPEYLKIEKGRCQCAKLDTCVPARKRASIVLLLPTLPEGDAYEVEIRAKRDRWGVACGACPPEDICDREELEQCPPPPVPVDPCLPIKSGGGH